MPRLNVLKNAGFTLLETLIVVLIIGIGVAIATPSFLSSLEKFRLEQAVVEVRSSFREAQRQAIRSGEACLLVMDLQNSKLTAPCINISERSLPDKVKLATNIALIEDKITGIDSEDSQLVASTNLTNLGLQARSNSGRTQKENYVQIGSCSIKVTQEKASVRCSDSGEEKSFKLAPVSFGILGTADFSIVKPNVPETISIDPSAKVVFYTSESDKSTKRCIAISNTLGLTRAGVYNGSTEPESITGSGICTATE
jgi:prepilin-type N-terminal cleavage/methylation domain-containing protein